MKALVMKNAIRCIAVGVLGGTYVTNAQVLNEKNYFLEARFVRAAGLIQLEKGESEPTFLATVADDTDLRPNRLFAINDNTKYPDAVCYYYSTTTNDWGPTVNKSLGVITNNTTGNIDYEIFSWEHDGGKRCVWNEGIDDNPNREYGSIHLPIYWSSAWVKDTHYSKINTTKRELEFCWRYANGDRSAPLDFGLVSAGEIREHINRNLKSPEGADERLGYCNSWSEGYFSDAIDVTYTFTIDQLSEINLNTQGPATDFDAKVHVVQQSPNGYTYLAGSTLNDSGIIANVRAGSYTVIVEGNNEDDVGSFKLVLGVEKSSQNLDVLYSKTTNSVKR